jgi:hypothetical protein
LALLAAAAIVAVLAGAVVVATRSGGGDDVVTVGPVDGGGTWETLTPAPLEARTDEVAVATDDEMIIWGGTGVSGTKLSDGAAYDFDTGTWRTLAPSPLSPRAKALAVWTGTEVVVWGGSVGTREGLSDGAAYDPASDTWRPLPRFQNAKARSDRTVAVWTGDEIVLVGVTPNPVANPAFDTLAFDPITERWRGVATLEDPGFGIRRAVWTGEQVVVTTASVDETIRIERFDPVRTAGPVQVDTSRTTVPGFEVTAEAVWTGDRVALVGLVTPGVLIDPATGDTTPLDAADPAVPYQYPTVLLDGGIVSVGDRWLDLASGTWHDAAPIPEPERYGSVGVSHDHRLYLRGGSGCEPDAACDHIALPGTGLIWTPPSE